MFSKADPKLVGADLMESLLLLCMADSPAVFELDERGAGLDGKCIVRRGDSAAERKGDGGNGE